MFGEALKTTEKESYMTQKSKISDVGIPDTLKKSLKFLIPPRGRHKCMTSPLSLQFLVEMKCTAGKRLRAALLVSR